MFHIEIKIKPVIYQIKFRKKADNKFKMQQLVKVQTLSKAAVFMTWLNPKTEGQQTKIVYPLN